MHFSRSLRRLEADSPRRHAFIAVGLVTLLVLWAAWLTASKITIYATSTTARIEVNRENQPIEALVGGRVVVPPPPTGRLVHAGDVLLELDASPERLEQSQMLSRITPSERQIQSLEDEIAAQQRALGEEARSAEAANAESAARARETAAAAAYAEDEAQRLRTLRASGIVSELDALRAEKLAEQRRNESETASFAAGRIARDLQARREDRLARIARLNNEIAAIEVTRSDALAGSARLTYDIAQRVIRAPITGRLAETLPLKTGSLIHPGDVLCTIVPDGALKAVAFFTPATALGRVHEGQEARLRLEGFPWTQYGVVPAFVSSVSGEVRDGKIRVELTLQSGPVHLLLQHGLPAEVDIQVEQLSPLAMILRSAGNRLRVNAVSGPTPSGGL